MRRAQPWRTNRGRALRSRSTSAESRLWSRVRNSQLGGLKFVRQASVGSYFVDFLCREHKVIIEIDGGTHSGDSEIAQDTARTAALQHLGYRIFRIHNIDVYKNIDHALDAVLAFVESASR